MLSIFLELCCFGLGTFHAANWSKLQNGAAARLLFLLFVFFFSFLQLLERGRTSDTTMGTVWGEKKNLAKSGCVKRKRETSVSVKRVERVVITFRALLEQKRG